MIPIKGWENQYSITEDGQIFSHKTNKYITPILNKKGYLVVRLYKNNMAYHYLVHRLVAQTFIPNPNNFEIVNHKDENKKNNCVNNLEWCDNKYNTRYSFCRPIRRIEDGKIYQGLSCAVEELGGSAGNLYKALNGKTRTFKGYHWEYILEGVDE